jgi:hypothetical protein
MELAGKYLIATIKTRALVCCSISQARHGPTALDIRRPSRRETAGVGVWLAIEEIVNPEGMITSAPRPHTVLIRWEWIVTAVLTTEKPIDPKSVKIVGSQK